MFIKCRYVVFKVVIYFENSRNRFGFANGKEVYWLGNVR